MNEQWLWVLLTVGEVLFVVLLVLLVSWLRNQAARRRDRKAIQALVAETKKLKDQRREQIGAFLSARFGLSGDVLARAVRGVYKAELQLIQAFANIYLHRDALAAAGFRRHVEDGVEPYWELSTDGLPQATESSAASEAAVEPENGAEVAAPVEESLEDPELARLRGENVRLSEELRVTMDTMSRMLNEYSTIFSKDSDLRDITVLDEEGEVSSDDDRTTADTEAAPATAADDAAITGLQADESSASPTDPDGTQAHAEGAASMQTEDLSAVDPDAILAAAQAADALALDDGEGDAAASAQDLALDPAMKDLSLDEEQGAEEGVGQAEAERQRIIDADS